MGLTSRHGIIKPTVLADIICLERHARAEDRREVEDLSGKSLGDNLTFALQHARPCLTARTRKGELLGIFGIVPIGEDQEAVSAQARTGNTKSGAIAFVGTDAITQNKRALLRGSRDVLAYLEAKSDYGFLFNVVDARNEIHISWLKWLGFSMIRLIQGYGAAKIPVIEFAKVTKRS